MSKKFQVSSMNAVAFNVWRLAVRQGNRITTARYIAAAKLKN